MSGSSVTVKVLNSGQNENDTGRVTINLPDGTTTDTAGTASAATASAEPKTPRRSSVGKSPVFFSENPQLISGSQWTAELAGSFQADKDFYESVAEECQRKASSSGKKGDALKVINFSLGLLLACGTAISSSSDNSRNAAIAVGVIVTISSLIQSYFTPGENGVKEQQASLALQELASDITFMLAKTVDQRGNPDDLRNIFQTRFSKIKTTIPYITFSSGADKLSS